MARPKSRPPSGDFTPNCSETTDSVRPGSSILRLHAPGFHSGPRIAVQRYQGTKSDDFWIALQVQMASGATSMRYPEPGVVEHTTKLVEIDQKIVEEAVQFGVEAGTVVRESVDGEPWLYLTALHRAEVGLAQSVHRIASATPHPLPTIDVEKAIAWVEGKLGIKLAAGQQEAIRQACQQKMLVITGGPGVGKTTLVRSILEIFTAKKLKCVLAAPTGRAAKRLAETTGRTAKTIHRLLEFDPATGEFKRNQQNPLKGDLFVLDEVSMVDVVLGHQFFRAVPSNACVILVGDVDQLPSVGPGTVLADLIASGVVPVVRLTEIFRQAAESQIVTAAYAINQGRMPEPEAARGTERLLLHRGRRSPRPSRT